MAEKPSDFLDRYKPIKFPACGSQGSKAININKYRSGDVMSGNEWRTKAFKDLRAFILRTDHYADAANVTGDHSYSEATGFLIASDLKPVNFHYCPLDYIRQVFQGKGTPARFMLVLKMCDYYLNHASIDLAGIGWGHRVTDLQEYADLYIGMDCNGFVGAYLEENVPAAGVKNNIDIDSLGEYFGKDGNIRGSRFSAITDATEIRTGDILVRRKIDDTRHIALVDGVLGVPTKTKVQLRIAESNSPDGLTTRTPYLTKTKRTANGRNWRLATKEYDAVLRVN